MFMSYIMFHSLKNPSFPVEEPGWSSWEMRRHLLRENNLLDHKGQTGWGGVMVAKE